MTKDYKNIEVRAFAQMILRILSTGFMLFFSIASMLYFYKAYEVRQNNDLVYLINELNVANKELGFNASMPGIYVNIADSSANQRRINQLARRLADISEQSSSRTFAAELAGFQSELARTNNLIVLYHGLIARALSEYDAFNLLYVGTGEGEVRQRVQDIMHEQKINPKHNRELINYLLNLQDESEEAAYRLQGAETSGHSEKQRIKEREKLLAKAEFFLKSAALLRTIGEISEYKEKLLEDNLGKQVLKMREDLSAKNEKLLGEQARILAAAAVLFALGAAFTAMNFYYGLKMSSLLQVFYKTFMRSPVQQSLIRVRGKEFSSELTNSAFRFGSGMLRNLSSELRSKEDESFYAALDRVLAMQDDTRGYEVGTLVYESHNKIAPYNENVKVNRKDGKFFTIFRRQISDEFELINKIDVSKMIWQIKDHKEMLESLRRKLEYDELTGTLSLQALQDNEINNPKGSTNKIFLYLHIDDFSSVRLNYSTVIIDEIIKTFANSLRNALDSADNHAALASTDIYHLQLDEFAIVYDSLASAQEAAVKINKHFKNHRHISDARNKFDLRFGNDEKLVDLELNIGISSERDIVRMRSTGANESINRLAQAIIASYESARIKAPYVVYEEGRLGVEIQYFKQQKMTEQIREALASDSVYLMAQGVHDSRSLEPQYYELLVRMRDSAGSTVPPAMFLDIARRVGLYKDIQRVVISKAFKLLEAYPQASFSVNLANSDIVSDETRRFFLGHLERCKNPQNLCVEILESEGIEQYDEVAEFLNAVKSRGAKVAIDDFGSGYSNYYRLLKVQFDYLKVDGSIISSLPFDANAHVVLKTIVDFAHEQGYEVVAEYVCNAEILQIIRDFGIDKSQGYELSKPELPELIFN